MIVGPVDTNYSERLSDLQGRHCSLEILSTRDFCESMLAWLVCWGRAKRNLEMESRPG